MDNSNAALGGDVDPKIANDLLQYNTLLPIIKELRTKLNVGENVDPKHVVHTAIAALDKGDQDNELAIFLEEIGNIYNLSKKAINRENILKNIEYTHEACLGFQDLANDLEIDGTAEDLSQQIITKIEGLEKSLTFADKTITDLISLIDSLAENQDSLSGKKPEIIIAGIKKLIDGKEQGNLGINEASFFFLERMATDVIITQKERKMYVKVLESGSLIKTDQAKEMLSYFVLAITDNINIRKIIAEELLKLVKIF